MTLLDTDGDRASGAAYRQAASSSRSLDPLGPVLALGRRQVRIGFLIGIAGAFFVHGGAAARGLSTLVHLSRFAAIVDQGVAERLRATYDVDFTPPPEAEVPEPEPEPEPKPEPTVQKPPDTPVPNSDNPYVDPPPEAAQAGKVLTADPDPDAPLDLTDQGFVTGPGDRYSGGTTSSDGTSKQAVYDRKAKPGGKPGGTGTQKGGGGPAPKENLTKPAGLLGGGSWNDCGFPPEADMDQVDFGVVTLTVQVGTDGRPRSVSILADPGHGFGRLARSCAMRKRYTPGLDAFGNATVKNTPPIRVRFTR
ncbi:MAG: hypothetical protein R3B13_30345 [Polyangiaceae bacterium]